MTKVMRSAAAALIVMGATAAIALAAVPNGDFESGSFDGWEHFDSNDMMKRATATGQWQVYKGKLKVDVLGPRGGDPNPPKLDEPPQGTFAAGLITSGPGSHILHRVLEANGQSELSLQLTFKNTANDFFAPDTLSSESPRGLGGFKNQQLRIDLIEPGAPIDTVEKSDIIKTLFRTKPGDKRKRDWSKLEKTVPGGEFRLRIAEVDNQAPFIVGIDALKLRKK
jgi:hypothetical protein